MPKKLENISYYSLEDLQKLSKEELVELAFKENQAKLEYWRRLNQNSNNSSRPPSTDLIGDKLDKSDRRKHKNRKKSTKKSGGQTGHIGTTLAKQKATKIVQIYQYNPSKKPGEILKTCQVIDVKTFKEITEYQLIATKTKNTQTLKAKLPFKNVIYSTNLKAQIAYFSVEHAISDDRILKLFSDLYRLKISGGTVTNALFKAKNLLKETNTKILNSIQKAKVLGSDETFMSLGGKLAFLWNWQNPKYSYFKASQNRKHENITQTIPNYQGTLVSDRYAAHLKLNCKHQLCLVHLQRNVKALPDCLVDLNEVNAVLINQINQTNQANQTSQNSQTNLTKIASSQIPNQLKIDLLEIFGSAQKAEKTEENYQHFRQRLKFILEDLPKNLDKESQKLAKSLTKNQNHIFEFLKNPEIPHHNNDTERELRKSKIKSKIAGCFRTLNGFETYASILTFIQTCRKQGVGILCQLQKIFDLEAVDLEWAG